MILLSHQLSEDSPAYGGGVSLKRKSLKKINCGDSCNQEEFSLSGHLGTHIDFPNHFIKEGKSCTDYPVESFLFSSPTLIDVEVDQAELIYPEMLAADLPKDIDLLLMRTGMESVRSEEAYWKLNPGVAVETGKYLKQNFPCLRAIGFDFISLSSYQHRDVGRKSHKVFLSDPEILIIEDMALSKIKNLMSVIVAPLFIQGADGVPCSVFGFTTPLS